MDPIHFDPVTRWVNVNDPDNVPVDAKVLTAEDLLRFEKLGQDVAEWTANFSGGGGGGPLPGVIDGGTP
ncbi:hypothetical protein SEA_BRUHMOMENT_34 [Arthrobacter phage BruhMoment]|nr:hypothetical protein SEA_BRUHMOMENT_34 [Arthrobacter phage BruhMoment]